MIEMKKFGIAALLVLSLGFLLQCDDDLPWLEFPTDITSRPYKIGNVAIVEDPSDPQSIIAAFELIEGLSQGGPDDIAVVTSPIIINWDGQLLQEHEDFISTLKRYNIEVNLSIDPLPHRYFLGGQNPPPPASTFSDPDVRQKFKQYAIDALIRTEPDYITLGVEVNMFYHGEEIEDFVYLNSLINETAALVRSIAPETKIITSFQWEHFILFRKERGWEPLENYEWNVDLIGLSTFPLGILKVLDPSRLPDDYYAEIYNHLPPNLTPETLKLTFSEMSFPSRMEPEGGWDGSEKHQNNGVVRFLELVSQLDSVEFVNYWYLHDDCTLATMTSFGLIESASTPEGTPGKKKPSFYVWEQLAQLPYIPN